MAQGRRVERVAASIRREVSELLVTGIKDDRVNLAMVSVTNVVVAGDLQHCKIRGDHSNGVAFIKCNFYLCLFFHKGENLFYILNWYRQLLKIMDIHKNNAVPIRITIGHRAFFEFYTF